jgi:hypothetical protein
MASLQFTCFGKEGLACILQQKKCPSLIVAYSLIIMSTKQEEEVHPIQSSDYALG